MKVKIESKVTQSCPTLSNPVDCSLPGSSIHEIFQARVLEWGAIDFSEHQSIYTQNFSSLEFSPKEFIFKEWITGKDNFIEMLIKA